MHINLLPWREQLREERKQEFLVSLAAAAVLTIIIILFVHLVIAAWINNQEGRNKVLENQIALLNNEIREIKNLRQEGAELLARMQIIQTLQANRAQVVRTFDDFVRIMPDGVYLTSVKRVGTNFTIIGKAESNTRVSALMRNIDSSISLEQPLLTEIKTDPSQGSRDNDFIMQFKQRAAEGAMSQAQG